MTADAPIRVIGTAGHVDHGKSTLIRALTGIDPDRLREEQERGMTIDLGFAWLTLPGGADVGIVDVPGHQDFIRNMLAGVGGIDAVVLVVAADEGIMPQTKEHLAILELLGIERGVVALSKRDLVDDEWAALVQGEVRAAIARTPLADVPIVELAATTGLGLPELLAALESVLGAAPPRRDLGRPRLPIDRAFTMTGFGTVVTGTLADGSLAVGEEIELVPGGLRGRIRGLQTHRHAIDVARPGSRVAANLSGVEKEAVVRGMVLGHPGILTPTSAIGVRLSLLPDVSGPLEHGDTVRLHVGTAEAIARVSVLEGESIEPGESAWVQLRLAAPMAVLVGDRPERALAGGPAPRVVRRAPHAGGGRPAQRPRRRGPRRRVREPRGQRPRDRARRRRGLARCVRGARHARRAHARDDPSHGAAPPGRVARGGSQHARSRAEALRGAGRAPCGRWARRRARELARDTVTPAGADARSGVEVVEGRGRARTPAAPAAECGDPAAGLRDRPGRADGARRAR